MKAIVTPSAISPRTGLSRALNCSRTMSPNGCCGLAQASDRVFAVCLSGGSTPRRLYECLATPEFASRFPWSRDPLVLGRRTVRAAR